MEVEEPVKTGILFTPPQTFLRRSWPKRFCALYTASSYGIQRLEVFDNDGAFMKQSKSPSKIIALTDCVKVTPAPQKQQANVFEVRTMSGCYQFSADNFQEMTEWLGALQTVAFGLVRPSSCSSMVPSIVQNVKQEENLLYSSMDDPEIYSVTALSTDSMLRNNLLGDYKLIITSVSISVAEDKLRSKVGRTILTWPYRHIRRYGCSKDNFSFEAGRKCTSGEGLFAFGTLDGSLIFQSVDAHVASLKSSQSDNDAPASPFLDDEKNDVFTFKESMLISKEKKSMDNSHVSKVQTDDKYYDEIGVEKERSVVKPTISKPPRKSKQSLQKNLQLEIEDNKPLFSSPNIDSDFFSNVYEEPETHIEPSSSKFQENKYNEYDVEMQTSVLKYDTKLNLPATYEPIYAVLEENSTRNLNWKVLPEDMNHLSISANKNCTSNEKCFMRRRSEQELDSYDHLSLKTFDICETHASKNHASDHIYGKLLPTRPCSDIPESHPENSYGSLKIQRNNLISQGNITSSSHSPYTNIQTLKALSSLNPQENAIVPDDTEPKHFLRNNAEYAKILKSKK